MRTALLLPAVAVILPLSLTAVAGVPKSIGGACPPGKEVPVVGGLARFGVLKVLIADTCISKVQPSSLGRTKMRCTDMLVLMNAGPVKKLRGILPYPELDGFASVGGPLAQYVDVGGGEVGGADGVPSGIPLSQ